MEMLFTTPDTITESSTQSFADCRLSKYHPSKKLFMKNSIFNLFILISLVLVGCETTEKIDDFPLRPSKLVVNCYFNTDSTWKFQVSKSLSVLDNAEIKLIRNANIKLYKEGELLNTISSIGADGWYRSPENFPEEGKEYSIEVTSPDFKDGIQAKDVVPVKPSILNAGIIVTDSSFYDHGYYYYSYGYVKGSFEITLADQMNVSNYYQLKIYYMDSVFNNYTEEREFSHLQKSLISITSEDMNVENSREYGTSLLINDYMIDGQNYTLSVDFNDWNAMRKKEYLIELTSITRSGYLYRKTIDESNNSRNDPFAEPVMIYSNVSNGFGIFSAYSSGIYSLVAPF